MHLLLFTQTSCLKIQQTSKAKKIHLIIINSVIHFKIRFEINLIS